MTTQEFEAIYSTAIYWDSKIGDFKPNHNSTFHKDLNALIKEAQREVLIGYGKKNIVHGFRTDWIKNAMKWFEEWNKQQEK